MDLADELREIHREQRRLYREIRIALEAHLFHAEPLEGLELMSALDTLTALEPRLDALLALVPTDIAAAVAAQKAADAADVQAAQDALAQAQADATTKEASLQAVADALTTKVAALETALGAQGPTGATGATGGATGGTGATGGATGATGPATSLTVSPASVVEAAGVAFTAPVSVAGGQSPYNASGLLAGVSWDGSGNLIGDGTQQVGSSTVTFSDSSASPLSGSLSLTIS